MTAMAEYRPRLTTSAIGRDLSWEAQEALWDESFQVTNTPFSRAD